MPNPEGSFIWYELMTSDPDNAARFYAEIVGWTVGGFGGGEDTKGYRIFSADGEGIAGLMQLPDGAPNPGWFAYLYVADVDAKARAIEAAGGKIHMPATDLEGVGRIAMVADPQGLVFYIMNPRSPDPNAQSHVFAPERMGHCAWNELVTSSLPDALDFYVSQLGWTKAEAMSMGAMGDYQFIDHGGLRLGAMMQTFGDWPLRWTFYFRVPDVDALLEPIAARGGAISNGPHDVPGGGRIVIGTDPQGATFALVSGGVGEPA
jgi:predicted enzyme related to lactoylglutathione lyase